MKKKDDTNSCSIILRLKIILFFGVIFSGTQIYSQPVCNAPFGYYMLTNTDSMHFISSGVNDSSAHYSWSFGDGNNSDTVNPWHVFPAYGNYFVCLTVYDSTAAGTCSATWCDSVHAFPQPPVCDAQFSYYTQGNPDSLIFIHTGSNLPGTVYAWNFGDSLTSADTNPWHLFAQHGTYLVCLTVYDSTAGGTCSLTWCDSVRVVPPPPACNAEFISYMIPNDSVQFVAAGNSAGSVYLWSFGDTSYSTLVTPRHHYAQYGTYTACLTVYDSTEWGTCTATWCDSVPVIPMPPDCNAEFSSLPAGTIDSIHFIHTGNNLSGAIYSWNFGDSMVSDVIDPWHSFTQYGTYYVCLTVYDSTAGGTCSHTWCDSISFILPPPSCDVQFYYYSPINTDSAYFVSTGNVHAGMHYSWDFGDSTYSTDANPAHQYAQYGTYYVCLTVYDTTAGGTCSYTWCDSISIFLPVPYCDAQFYYYSVSNPDSVHFMPAGNNGAGSLYTWDFGDGNSSSDFNPWHLYASHGTYYVCLTVHDSTAGGTCSHTWCDSIYAFPPPPFCDATFSYFSTNSPDSIYFSSSQNNIPGTLYSWDFGDGNFSSAVTPLHLYAQDGTYFACLSVYDSTSGGTCTASWCDSIHAFPLPSCMAQFTSYSVGNPDSVHFICSSSNHQGTVYSWDFGDGGSSNSMNPWYLYTHYGVYYTCLTVYDSTAGGACTTTWCDSVQAVPVSPVCDAHFSSYSINDPDSVHFVSTGNNAASAVYSWDFGDGGTSNAVNPWHLYAQPGTYFACLSVYDSTAGGTCTSTWCDSVHIILLPPSCNAQFYYSSLSYPDSVHFGSSGGNTSSAVYSWDFGDGGTSNSLNPWHLYAQPGTYFACLNVYDSTAGGICTSAWCDSVHVILLPPSCNAQFYYSSLNNPDSVHFVSPGNNTPAAVYSWDFGDGGTSNAITPWHLYAQHGIYYACLTVNDSTASGTCTSTWCDSVRAFPAPPNCDAEFTYVILNYPDSVRFLPLGNYHPGVNYTWDFGDGTFSSNFNPWHLYAQDGVYFVCLTVYDSTAGGTCTATWCDSVRALPGPPACDAQFTYHSVNYADNIQFVSPANPAGSTYSWTFGDGAVSGNASPLHIYTQSGTYYVCLTVYNSNVSGTCTSTWCDSVLVLPVIPLCNAAFSFVHPVNSDSIQFIVSGNNHPGTLYYWHFDDSTYSTDMNPWHRYNQNGMYHVCLDVYDSTSAGTCTSTWCDTVLIDFILPNCNADFLQYSQFNPYHVYFIPASNNQSTAKYHWDFGDGNFSGERFPAHFYHHSGTYTICLEVSDSLLSRTCSASRCRVLTIPDTKYLLVFPNPVHQNESIIVRNIVSLFNCRILDGTGRLIWNEDNIIETEKIIDLNGISAGIYFVEVSGANQPASTWKLIVLE